MAHHLKRLRHDNRSSDLHDFSHNHDNRSHLPNDEQIRESMQNFTVAASSSTKQSRPVRHFKTIFSSIFL